MEKLRDITSQINPASLMKKIECTGCNYISWQLSWKIMLTYVNLLVNQAIVAAAEEVEVAVDDTETLGTLVTAAEGEVEDGQLLIDGIMVEESLGLGRGEDMPMIVGVVVLGGVKGKIIINTCLSDMVTHPVTK